MAQQWAKKFYKSKKWQEARMYALRRDNFLCQAEACYKPAEEVHHIIHLTPQNIDDPAIALNPDNLVSLCRDCHFKEHRKERKDTEVLPKVIFINGRPVVHNNTIK